MQQEYEPVNEEPVQQKETPGKKFVSGPDVKCGSHLKSSDELTGMPVFPAGTKSLLSKHLTRDVFNKYIGVKDPYEFPF